MPIPLRVTRFNRRFANPVVRRFAGYVPPLALVCHHGRRSGALYRTPVLAFPRDGAFLIALTYGRDVDWLKNVLAAGACSLTYRGRHYVLGEPEIFESNPRSVSLPWLVRVILGWLRVTTFLRMRVSPGHPTVR